MGVMMLSLADRNFLGLRLEYLLGSLLPPESLHLSFSTKGSSSREPFVNLNLSGEHLPHFLGRKTICYSLHPGTNLCRKGCEKYQAPRYLSNSLNQLSTHRKHLLWTCIGFYLLGFVREKNENDIINLEHHSSDVLVQRFVAIKDLKQHL